MQKFDDKKILNGEKKESIFSLHYSSHSAPWQVCLLRNALVEVYWCSLVTNEPQNNECMEKKKELESRAIFTALSHSEAIQPACIG